MGLLSEGPLGPDAQLKLRRERMLCQVICGKNMNMFLACVGSPGHWRNAFEFAVAEDWDRHI